MCSKQYLSLHSRQQNSNFNIHSTTVYLNTDSPFTDPLLWGQLGLHQAAGPEVGGEHQDLGGGGGEAGQAVSQPRVQERVETSGLNISFLQHHL